MKLKKYKCNRDIRNTDSPLLYDEMDRITIRLSKLYTTSKISNVFELCYKVLSAIHLADTNSISYTIPLYNKEENIRTKTSKIEGETDFKKVYNDRRVFTLRTKIYNTHYILERLKNGKRDSLVTRRETICKGTDNSIDTNYLFIADLLSYGIRIKVKQYIPHNIMMVVNDEY